MISPIENPILGANLMAIISVPSSEPLFLRIKPTPNPKTSPPNTVAKSKSSVITWLWHSETKIDKQDIPQKVLNTNLLPNFCNAKNMKGTFKQKCMKP